MQAKTKNRLTIIFTAVLFMAPVVVAYMLSSGLIEYQPDSTKNHGHFVSPLVKLADHTDAPWAQALAGHWTLIRRTPEACGAQCPALETDLHKYRLSLGHRLEKMQLMLMADDFLSDLPDAYPHIQKVSLAGEEALVQVMDELSQVSLQNGHGLYVVAPEGYLMMAFTPENTSSEIIKDLSLLVKRKGD
ncbi:hypothetical protein [Marinicella meishanensis]|uniref:hypothetical protein n=1 Tax=Marinicella meishanensis TaxID=2873263 RepID=UPI001CBCEB92|nr:hypothetical protein [Marinicella sp. NBU2979]